MTPRDDLQALAEKTWKDSMRLYRDGAGRKKVVDLIERQLRFVAATHMGHSLCARCAEPLIELALAAAQQTPQEVRQHIERLPPHVFADTGERQFIDRAEVMRLLFVAHETPQELVQARQEAERWRVRASELGARAAAAEQARDEALKELYALRDRLMQQRMAPESLGSHRLEHD